jgi:putative hydrolase of the HAD superfamily
MDPLKEGLKLEVRPTLGVRSPRELLIFSLDDTLIDTSLYWRAKKAFARAVAAKTGTAEELATEDSRTYEITPKHESVTVHDTWEEFRKECAIPPEGDNDLYMLVARLLRCKFPPAISGAEDLVKWAAPLFTLAMLTSGDRETQVGKLEDSKLRIFFKDAKIVPAKGVEDFRTVISEMGFSPRNSWVIGSSMREDINPGLEAGANCILYTSPHPRRVGSREKAEEPLKPIFRIHELLDARAILAKPSTSLAA